jgi:hypothetical protein
MGRFMSPDWSAKEEPVPYAKLDNPQTLNLYAYMRNNPLGGADPDGHCCEEDAEEEINESKEANEELSRINETFNRREAAAADLREQQAVGQFNESHPGGYDDANGVSHVGPASRQDVEQMQAENRDKLFGSPTGAYKRPNNATTQEQRDDAQGKACSTCGATGQKNNADHIDPLVEQHYRGGIDKTKMRSPDATRPQCQSCSNQQGGYLRTFSVAMKKLFGF